MVTTNDVRSFIKADCYISLLNRTILTLQLKVKDEEEPSTQDRNIQANSLNRANIALDRLLELCVEDADKLIRFIKLKELNIEDEIDEYNDDDEKAVLVEVLGITKTFLIGHLIEYFFLKNDPKGLDNYLKAIRIPNHKKYSVQLKVIYGQL